MRNTADLLVDQFESYGIEYIFCVPGASIDAITTSLLGRKTTKLVVCRLEDPAGYAAIAYAKKTGKPAIVMVTDGPGATNVVTAAATATLEHVPLIIICGQANSSVNFKPSHQVINAQAMFAPVTKYSFEVQNINQISSIWDYAYTQAVTPAYGAVHLSFPSNLLATPNQAIATKPINYDILSQATELELSKVAKLVSEAKCPVMILGGDAETPEVFNTIMEIMDQMPIATVASFAATGLVCKRHQANFMGKLGIFQNQPCDALIKKADLVLCVGYNIAELDPISWNDDSKMIIHISNSNPIVSKGYRPHHQLLGNIAVNLKQLTQHLSFQSNTLYEQLKSQIRGNSFIKKI